MRKRGQRMVVNTGEMVKRVNRGVLDDGRDMVGLRCGTNDITRTPR